MAEETFKDQLLKSFDEQGLALAKADLTKDLTPDDPAFEVSKKEQIF